MLDLLKNAGIFSRLTLDELKLLSDNSELCAYKQEETVFEAGEPAKELYIVRDGEVSVSRQSDSGKSIRIARLIPGDVFGELEFFKHAPRNASARASAIKETVLLRFPKEGYDFQDMLKKEPRISAKLLHSFIALIAGRIRSTNKLISDNSPLVQEMRRQVYGDSLTGMFNKAYMEEQLHTFLTNPGKPVALLMIKPDNFKWINDNCGHDAGDETIRILARAYAGNLNDGDVAARFMGNEFGFIMPGLDKEKAFESALGFKELVHSLDLTEVTGNEDFRLTASVGIAVYPLHATTSSELIGKAHELPLIGRGKGGGKILFPEDKENPRG